MDPDVVVTILLVAYTVVVCAGIGAFLLTQREQDANAADAPHTPSDRLRKGARDGNP
jgi:hypothetical protein